MKVPSSLRRRSAVWLFAFTALGTGAVLAQEEPPRPAATSAPAVSPTLAEPVTPVPPSEPAEPADNRDRDRDWNRGRGERHGDADVRFGGSVSVAAGEVHDKEIVVMGGSARVAGSQKGDVVVLGGSCDISGDVRGTVVVMGGRLRLAPSASIRGDVVVLGGGLHKEDGATITGQTVELGSPGTVAAMMPAFDGLNHGFGVGLFTLSILAWLKTAVLMLVLTLILAALIPARIEAAAGVLRERWLACLGWGLVAAVAVFPLALLLCVTCVGWIVPILLYQVAKYFGMAALFAVVGNALGRNVLQRELTLIPSLLVGFLALALIGLLGPTWIWTVYGWAAVGCAIITKFGALQPWFRPGPPATPITPATDVLVRPPAAPTSSDPML